MSCGGEVSYWVTTAIETFVKGTGALVRHFAPKRWPAIGKEDSHGRGHFTELYTTQAQDIRPSSGSWLLPLFRRPQLVENVTQVSPPPLPANSAVAS